VQEEAAAHVQPPLAALTDLLTQGRLRVTPPHVQAERHRGEGRATIGHGLTEAYPFEVKRRYNEENARP
jgi:hypothetical protein